MGRYTMIDEDVLEQALDCARGRYQISMLEDDRPWSGMDLVGKAKSYAGRYRDSRENLLARLRESGLSVRRVPDPLGHGAICYRICRGHSEQNVNV